ncbi:formate dehydrogenase subunit gamma [Skermanella stibiiresistens SB22]|uniref:Formate dehydrogenase subunit gamma n=1 Tax=Skermanella stibiiresistens SB22 TaxID=1385369 RepID=W9GSJ4_9PROT|nr:formate dehydrogenase subunit gamma [Skermanella stibiiresistens]EWY36719.1 formate dehydrogenase subunit gamma [Skermanella stibiiresistens SB22]
MADHAPWTRDKALAIVESYRGQRGSLLPILHDLQHEFGFIDDQAVPLLANALNLSRAEVHGVISFYHDFKREPQGRTVVKVCRAEACQAVGADRLVEHAARRLGVPLGGTRADGAVTLEGVFCLGNCALGPTVMIDDHLHGRVDANRFDALAAPLAAQVSGDAR